MKSRLSLAALVAVFIALYAFKVEGQPNSAVPSGLPTWIPTFATSDQMNEWLVTNQSCYVAINIHYTTTAQGSGLRQYPESLGTYSTYGAYQNYIVTNTIVGISGITNADWSKTAWLEVIVLGSSSEQYASLHVRATNSMLSGITAQWISNNLAPSVVYVNVSVPDLQQFDIQVQMIQGVVTNLYSYHTNLVTQNGYREAVPQIVPPPYPPERTTANWLVLNPWYLFQTNRARFTATIAAGSQEYTQMGAAMTIPQVTMLGSMIQASVPVGSDVTLLYSSDLAHPTSAWQTNSVSQWSLNTNMLRWNVSLTDKNGFFGVKLN